MKLWIAATLAAFLLAACNARAYLPYRMDDWFANTEQAMTPDTDGGADIEQMHMDYLDTTPDVNVEFGEIMQPETGVCLKNFYIFAFTSGYVNAGSDQSHKVTVKLVDGKYRSIVLPHLPKDDCERLKGDLWKLTFSGNFNFTGCITRKDISSVTIVAANKDGWNIESIVTYVGANDHDLTEFTRDINVFRWIDGDGKPSRRKFSLTKV